MGLRVQTLGMRDWRNFEDRDIDFSDGVTILVGPNAVGKTNSVEALQLLTAGASFRRPKPQQLIREGAETARITANLRGDGRVVDQACDVTPRKRTFSHNGKVCRSADMPRTLMSVLFNPDDLAIVKQGASQRRDEIDAFGRQAAASYGNLLAAYQRTVEQRNRLLKEPYPDLSLLDAWDASLAVGGAALLAARTKLFCRLADKMRPIYAAIADGEELGVEYRSALGEVVGVGRDELAVRLAAAIAAGREEDLRRQQTCVGPHRDDLVFFVRGREARTYGSQGQQRSVVLAWKMAEVEVASDVLGDKPLLLLDDVMSELDEARRNAVVGFVGGGIQTVITTTNLGYFNKDLLAAAKVVDFDG